MKIRQSEFGFIYNKYTGRDADSRGAMHGWDREYMVYGHIFFSILGSFQKTLLILFCFLRLGLTRYTALDGLQLTMLTWLASNLQHSPAS